MTANVAYSIFEVMAEISGKKNRLHKWGATKEQRAEEEIRELSVNRHHFKQVTFGSSLTGKRYGSRINSDGSLGIYDHKSSVEIESFSEPSKSKL